MQRYVFDISKEEVIRDFGVNAGSDSIFIPSFNVYPGAQIPIIVQEKGTVMVWAYWQGADDETFNIKSEDFIENPNKYRSLGWSPCIIPISGFYLWKETVKDPLPFYIRRLSYPVLGVAGLFRATNRENNHTKYEFAPLTVPANVLLQPLDDRMPCLLEKKDYEKWLTGEMAQILVQHLKSNQLIPDLAVYRVPELVNNPKNNSRDLIQPIPKLREDE